MISFFVVLRQIRCPFFNTTSQSRIGCKGKNKFWYGYKKSVSVDMQSGLINKVSLTPANVTDAKAMKYVLPSNGAVYADKGYATKQANKAVSYTHLTLPTILRV